MVEVLQILLSGGLIYGICHIVTVIGKCIVAIIVSKNNEISDDKAKSMTKMMSKFDVSFLFISDICEV